MNQKKEAGVWKKECPKDFKSEDSNGPTEILYEPKNKRPKRERHPLGDDLNHQPRSSKKQGNTGKASPFFT